MDGGKENPQGANRAGYLISYTFAKSGISPLLNALSSASGAWHGLPMP